MNVSLQVHCKLEWYFNGVCKIYACKRNDVVYLFIYDMHIYVWYVKSSKLV